MMGIEKNIVDGFVRLDLRHPGDFGSIRIGGTRSTDEIKRDLQTLSRAAEVRLNKHEDEFGGASIQYEYETVCEHCGAQWSEESKEYNGGCCDADEDGNAEQQRTTA